MIQNMSFLGLVVKDINAATAFYRDTLGLEINEKESIPEMFTQFELNGGAVFALINGFEIDGVAQSFDAAVTISNIDGTYAKWKESGVEMIDEPRDMPFGRTFLFRTPDGHVLRAIASPQAN